MKRIYFIIASFTVLYCMLFLMGMKNPTPGNYQDQSTGRIEIYLASNMGDYIHSDPEGEVITLKAKPLISNFSDENYNLPQYEYSFKIAKRSNSLYSSWYRYAEYLSTRNAKKHLIPNTEDGLILTVTTSVKDKAGQIIRSKRSNFFKDGDRIYNDNPNSRRGNESIIKRRPILSEDKEMIVLVNIDYIRPNSFQNKATLSVNTWSTRRCRFIECLLD